MSIISSDPLAFLLAQGGIVGTPLQEAGASGAKNLDVQQRGAVIGEPIPIVFCRRVDGFGGVLISPSATEARFEDNVSGDVTVSYHLVLSEGQIDSIQVRDIFQRSCRVGSFSQTYGKRAGTFIPGNFIDDSEVEAPFYCGTGGRYTGLSTLAFTVTIPAGFDQWNRQVHCFVRGGLHVTRLLDSVTGPSNNVADLLLYLLRNSSKVPEAQIDTSSLLAAATFTNANGFWFNGSVSESTNLRDWIGDTLPYFLLRQTRIGGKEALTSLLPTNSNGTIKTTAVTWAFTFTEEHHIPGSFEIVYTPLSDRKPFCATVLWRQQDDLGIPVMRTAEVRYAGTAIDGPFEQHDLSGFCASEDHAVKVGAFILSKRRHVTHRLQIGVRPDGFNPSLASGDLVRVRLDRVASTGAASVHDYLYEVDRIGKSITGEVQLELTHFPVDADLASVVAQEVAAAVGSGYVIPTGLSGVTCDVNESDDETVPEDTSLDPDDWNLPDEDSYNEGVDGEITIGDNDPFNTNVSPITGSPNFGNSNPTAGNSKDDLDKQDAPCIQLGNTGGHYVGQTYTVNGAESVQWLADGVAIAGATSNLYTTTVSDIGKAISAHPVGNPAASYVYCNPAQTPTANENYVGSSDPPPPAAGTDPNVRVYWILGNVFCMSDGTCAQGRTINGYITVNWSYYSGGNMRFQTVSSSYPAPNQCLCVGNKPSYNGCKQSISNPVTCDDLGCCTATVYFDYIQLLISGTWENNRSVTSNGLPPKFAIAYAP